MLVFLSSCRYFSHRHDKDSPAGSGTAERSAVSEISLPGHGTCTGADHKRRGSAGAVWRVRMPTGPVHPLACCVG